MRLLALILDRAKAHFLQNIEEKKQFIFQIFDVSSQDLKVKVFGNIFIKKARYEKITSHRS